MTISESHPTTMIIGASGLLGPYLMRSARTLGPVLGVSRHGPDIACDCLDTIEFQRILSDSRPSSVIFAAALTDVDRCERDPGLADALHRQAVNHLIDEIGGDAKLVYISTDQVYPDCDGPHGEPDVGPVNVYGRSKLAGELIALKHPGALVLRTNLFGPSLTPGRQSLSDFLLGKFRSGSELRLFSDSFFTPLHMVTVSNIVIELMTMSAAGVFNLGSREGMSKAQFGYLLAQHFNLSTENAVEVESAVLPGRAPRPRDMRMDVTRLEKVLNRRLPTLIDEVSKL